MPCSKQNITFDDYLKGIDGLKTEEQIGLMEVIAARLRNALKEKSNKHSILDLEGLGSNIWKGIDAQDHVRRERESWR